MVDIEIRRDRIDNRAELVVFDVADHHVAIDNETAFRFGRDHRRVIRRVAPFLIRQDATVGVGACCQYLPGRSLRAISIDPSRFQNISTCGKRAHTHPCVTA